MINRADIVGRELVVAIGEVAVGQRIMALGLEVWVIPDFVGHGSKASLLRRSEKAQRS